MLASETRRPSRPQTPAAEENRYPDDVPTDTENHEQISTASFQGSATRLQLEATPNMNETDHHHPTRFTENLDSRQGSVAETEPANSAAQRHSSLRKRNSLSRRSSLRRRSSSRGSRTMSLETTDVNSAFHLPVPTHSNPTEILANRFSAWRRILKDYIAYFKEAQLVYEARSKGISRLHQVLVGAAEPDMFLKNGGILETTTVLKDFHKSSMLANEHARQGLGRIVNMLTGLRNDLGTKIKEIKGLSGDFKNNLERERETTRKAVGQLSEALSAADSNPSLVTGKNDPYIVKLSVDKQLRKQLAEENYLHRAYLNLEGSGRELESIVITEIQKAFELYVKILRGDVSEMLDTAERLEQQTLGLPGDHEWTSFVERPNSGLVDPKIKIRSFEDVEYAGSKHPAATEVRSGLLERKSKYLKSYTPGWYALSPSHLHEFKTPDRNHDLIPVMSLYLPASTMGSHTDVNSSSHKFMIKGKQTGHIHRGHSWVFRADSHESMKGFYEDISNLIELSGAERNAFVASHQRARSSGSAKESGSNSSENGLDNDEADDVPYSAEQDIPYYSPVPLLDDRPEAGRFPSDIDVQRNKTPRSTTSVESDKSHAEAFTRSRASVAGDTLSETNRAATPASPIEAYSPGWSIRGVDVSKDHQDFSVGEERDSFTRGRSAGSSRLNEHSSQTSNDMTSGVNHRLPISNSRADYKLDQHQGLGEITSQGGDIAQHSSKEPAIVATQLSTMGDLPTSKSFAHMSDNPEQIDASTFDITLPPKNFSSDVAVHSSPHVFPRHTTRVNSNFTISELHVPGEYPEEAAFTEKRH